MGGGLAGIVNIFQLEMEASKLGELYHLEERACTPTISSMYGDQVLVGEELEGISFDSSHGLVELGVAHLHHKQLSFIFAIYLSGEKSSAEAASRDVSDDLVAIEELSSRLSRHFVDLSVGEWGEVELLVVDLLQLVENGLQRRSVRGAC